MRAECTPARRRRQAARRQDDHDQSIAGGDIGGRRYRRLFEPLGDRAIRDVSRGTRAKPDLLPALSRGADLLVRDKSTAGVDPATADAYRQGRNVPALLWSRSKGWMIACHAPAADLV